MANHERRRTQRFVARGGCLDRRIDAGLLQAALDWTIASAERRGDGDSLVTAWQTPICRTPFDDRSDRPSRTTSTRATPVPTRTSTNWQDRAVRTRIDLPVEPIRAREHAGCSFGPAGCVGPRTLFVDQQPRPQRLRPAAARIDEQSCATHARFDRGGTSGRPPQQRRRMFVSLDDLRTHWPLPLGALDFAAPAPRSTSAWFWDTSTAQRPEQFLLPRLRERDARGAVPHLMNRPDRRHRSSTRSVTILRNFQHAPRPRSALPRRLRGRPTWSSSAPAATVRSAAARCRRGMAKGVKRPMVIVPDGADAVPD